MSARCAAGPVPSPNIWCSSARSTTPPRRGRCGSRNQELEATLAAIDASDLNAFRRVLDDGRAGRLVPTGSAEGLATAVIELLGDDTARAELVARAQARAARYDWSRVADQILRVYETVTVGAGPVIISD